MLERMDRYEYRALVEQLASDGYSDLASGLTRGNVDTENLEHVVEREYPLFYRIVTGWQAVDPESISD